MLNAFSEARPPYVQFETRAEIDRLQSEKQGRVIYKNVDYVLITPSGSKDVMERIATEWLKSKEKDCIENRFKQQWLDHYKKQYEEWKKGNEIPLIGSALKEWPIVSPAEIEQLKEARIYTVEDLAECTEAGLAMIGMGGRVLRDKARAWLQSANDNGKSAERIANLEEELRRRDETIESLNKRMASLEATVEHRKGKAA